ncbi:MAG: beta-propeller fold lactonase family protein [Maricaulaceae bacterium]|jgi:YVTN family beta-propeller protein
MRLSAQTALAGVAAAALLGAGAWSGELAVVGKSSDTLTILDAETIEPRATAPTGAGPHEVAVSPDGRFAYVGNYNRDGVMGSTVTVVDVATGEVAATWDLGEHRAPHGMAVSSDGAAVWVTVEGSGALLELDATTGEIAREWALEPAQGHMVVATPDDQMLFVAHIAGGAVSIVDRDEGVLAALETGAGAEGIAVSPDGSTVWVTNRSANTLSIIDVASRTIVESFPAIGEMPIRAKFTPDGSEVWTSNARSAAVMVFDAETREHLATIDVGAVPVGILMEPDGPRAFVANTADDRVTIIDREAREVIRSFEAGDEPDGLAWIAED